MYCIWNISYCRHDLQYYICETYCATNLSLGPRSAIMYMTWAGAAIIWFLFLSSSEGVSSTIFSLGTKALLLLNTRAKLFTFFSFVHCIYFIPNFIFDITCLVWGESLNRPFAPHPNYVLYITKHCLDLN